MAANNSREARRRRITERGSDRLALITGRIHDLPASSRSLSELPPSVVSRDEDFSSLSARHDFSADTFQLNNYDGGTRAEEQMRKSETSSGESRPSVLDTDDKIKSTPISSTTQTPSISTPISSTTQTPSISTPNVLQRPEPQAHIYKSTIGPKQISSAVAASEMIRIQLSFAAAILVFLSYVGFPIIGSNIMKSIILFRPLYLLLVTNVSVVLAPLLLDKQRQIVSSGAETVTPIGAFQFGKALEIGLVLQQTLVALFMDCSVYSVVVVCLLSLAQKLGW